MKNIFILIIALFIVSCGNSSAPNAEKTVPSKVGKLNTKNTTIKKIQFEVDGKMMESTNMPYGCKMLLKVYGATGFKEFEGKYNCDVSITVYDSKNAEVLKMSNLLKGSHPQGMPVELFSNELFLSLICQSPIKINETYKVLFSAKDKLSDASFEVSEVFTMVPPTGLTYTEKGLSSDGPLIYKSSNPDDALSTNIISKSDTLYAYFTTITGLTEKDSLVWPDALIKITNESGETLAEFANLYGEYEKTGISTRDIKEMITLQVSMPTSAVSGKKYNAIFTVSDKKNKEKSFEAKYNFTIK